MSRARDVADFAHDAAFAKSALVFLATNPEAGTASADAQIISSLLVASSHHLQ